MSGAMTAATTDEWMQQFYDQQQQQQPLMDAMVPSMEGFSDATLVTTTGSPTLSSEGTNYYNSYSSSNNNIVQLNPKANNNALKPIRRRSRASKKTPTTLLNANTTNFRELVQQFTGCSSTSTAMSFSLLHKGPITLNFQQGSPPQQIQHSTSGTTTIMSQFGTTRSNYNNNQVHHHHDVAVPLPWQKQLPEQVPMQQNGSVPISYVNSSTVNDFSLHELIVNASFSNGIIKNPDGHFM